MKFFSEIKAILIGGAIGLTATDVASTLAQNYHVAEFLEIPTISWSILKPTKYQEWPTQDVREALGQKKDASGRMSCIHVLPISPEYQVTSTLEDGSRICCSVGENTVMVPVMEHDDSTDYFCGSYPDQQVVRVMKQTVGMED